MQQKFRTSALALALAAVSPLAALAADPAPKKKPAPTAQAQPVAKPPVAKPPVAAPPATGPIVLDAMVVTAQQREQSLINVPMTINALGAEEIEKRGVTDLQSLSYAVPEMITVVTGMAQNRVMLRGIGDNGGNYPLVGIYLDDIGVDGPLSRPLDIRPLDVERIEVLNGPQGTLYGQGSVGGTVRFLTQNPVIGKNSMSATTDVRATKGGSMSERLTGVANVSLSDRAALRIAGTYENVGGWIDAPTAGRKDINDGQFSQVRIKGLFNVNDSLKLTPMVQVLRNKVGSLNNGENADGNLMLPAFAPNAVQGASNDHEIYSLTADWDLGGASLLAVGSAFRNVSDGGYYSPFNGIGRLVNFENRDEARNLELRLTSDNSGRWKWAVGSHYRHADFYSKIHLYRMGPANGTTSTAANVISTTRIRSDSVSMYGNSSYDVTDRLEIGGGLRYFVDRAISPVAGQEDQRFYSLDPRLYISYKLQPNWNVYTSAAKGFRSGGFNAVNPAFPVSFEPESVWSYEVGTKYETPNRVFSGEVAGFISRYSNMQTTVIASNLGLSYTDNVGKANVKGIDWSFRVRPVDWMSFGATGAFFDTEVVSVAPNSAYIAGDRLNYIPHSNFSLFAEFETELKDGVDGRLRIDYNRRGSSVLSQRTARLVATNETLHLLNARGSVSWDRYRVDLYCDNILNDRGETYPNPVAFATRTVPLTVGLAGSVKF
jgi:iron complex outermembrane recepter protein